MTGVGDLSDDELLLLATGPVDSLAKQRKRGPRPAAQAAKSPHADISDEELLAAIGQAPGAPPPTSSYQGPTDYRAKAGISPVEDRSKLGPSSDENIAATENSRGILDRLGIDIHPDQSQAYGPAPADPEHPTAQEVERGQNPHDWLTENIVTGLPAAGVGKALAAGGRAIAPNAGPLMTRLGKVVQGGAEGAVATGLSGGDIHDVGMGAMLGAGMAGINRGAREARAPRTQAEMDAAVIHQYRAAHPDPVLNQMQGTHETYRLAKEANDAIAAKVDAREAANGELLNTADADFSMLDADYPIPETSGAIDKLQGIREQSYGGQGPMLGSDPVLSEMQRQLTIGKEGTPMVPRDVLRTVQRNLNEKAKFEQARGATQAEAALQQGAGVVSKAARAADPREGPGNLGGALDKYGADKDALRNVEELRGPEGGRESKLARVGGGDQTSDPGIHKAEAEVRDLQAAEPAGNKLIDRIRYNNTVGRRSLKMPYIGYSQTGNIERGLRQNYDNLKFKAQSKLGMLPIDEAGNVAGHQARYTNPLILPLELQLLMNQQQEERR